MDFDTYLQDRHMETYTGTDDDAPEAFESWTADFDYDDWMRYAEEFAAAEVKIALEAGRITQEKN